MVPLGDPSSSVESRFVVVAPARRGLASAGGLASLKVRS
jgi:hypothetical protein